MTKCIQIRSFHVGTDLSNGMMEILRLLPRWMASGVCYYKSSRKWKVFFQIPTVYKQLYDKASSAILFHGTRGKCFHISVCLRQYMYFVPQHILTTSLNSLWVTLRRTQRAQLAWEVTKSQTLFCRWHRWSDWQTRAI